MSTEKNEIMTTEASTYMTEPINLNDLFAEEFDGLRPSFERIKIPAGGGISFEVPGDDPDSPDTVKEFTAVILHHHPVNSYFKDKFNGANNPPECASIDGKIGVIRETGECRDCKSCPMGQFGSGENNSKACKEKRCLYLLREGEILPIIMTLPTGSLSEFTKYVTRLVAKGKHANTVVTRFSLKKAQNSTGIAYSQATFSVARNLTPAEKQAIASMSAQVRAMARTVDIEDVADEPAVPVDPKTGEVAEPLK